MKNNKLKFTKLDYFEAISSLILLILFGVGAILHFVPSTRQSTINLTELFLVLTNMLATVSIIYNAVLNKKLISNISWILVCFIITVSLEIIGVMTGMIFGNYIYGSVFEITFMDVPLIIGWNWVMIIAGATILSKQIYIQFLAKIISISKDKIRFVQIIQSPFAQYIQHINIAFLSSVIAVIVDYFLEPIAIKFDYWRWENNIVPIQNYASWMAIAFIFSLISMWFKTEIKSRLAVFLLSIQILFFILLSFI
jgi:putative membrane protein